jgi:putative glycosyltransferase (TIGR04372 family)
VFRAAVSGDVGRTFLRALMRGHTANLLLVRAQNRWERAKQEGVIGTAKFVGSFLLVLVLWLLLLPATITLHLAGFRRITVIGDRIGHLAAEVDCFLKCKALGEVPKGRCFFLAIPIDRVSNPHLLSYWREKLPVVSHPLLARLLETMSRWVFMRKDVTSYILRLDQSADVFRVNADWNDRPPILQLTGEDREWGQQRLRDLGVPDDAWFVCIHVREPGYSPGDESAHAHRNGCIENVIPAMREIVRRGGWCIRMGDSSMTRMLDCDNVIDYAHHALRSPRLDVVLCAQCRFLLGSTSGLAFVSAAFGVPSALANMIPFSALGLLPKDISIPKLLWSERDQRYLGSDEIMNSEVANFRYAKLYVNEGIRVDENSADDIADLVREMLDRLDERFVESDEDWELCHRFKTSLRLGHYSFGTTAEVATTFLRNHTALFDAQQSAQTISHK